MSKKNKKNRKHRKISFLANDGLVRVVDEYCRRTGQSRSHLIRTSLVYFLTEHAAEDKKFDFVDSIIDLPHELGKYFLSISPPKHK